MIQNFASSRRWRLRFFIIALCVVFSLSSLYISTRVSPGSPTTRDSLPHSNRSLAHTAENGFPNRGFSNPRFDGRRRKVGAQSKRLLHQLAADASVWQAPTRAEYFDLAPPIEVLEASPVQVGEHLFVIGGYFTDYNTAVSKIQILNVTSKKWQNAVQMPDGMATTHHAVCADTDETFLYIISGQTGGGCSLGTASAFQMRIETLEFKELPPLPRPRFKALCAAWKGVLHVTGGASELRNESAYDHWKLRLGAANSAWERGADIPRAGVHASAVQNGKHWIALPGGTLNQGAIDDESMRKCQVQAFANGQLAHHVLVSPAVYRLDLEGQDGQWERMLDAPASICHSSVIRIGAHAIVVGGASGTKQKPTGSPPHSLRTVLALDLATYTWRRLHDLPAVPGHLYNCAAWFSISASSTAHHVVLHLMRMGEHHKAGTKRGHHTYLTAQLKLGPDSAKTTRAEEHEHETTASSVCTPRSTCTPEQDEVLEPLLRACVGRKTKLLFRTSSRERASAYNAERRSWNRAFSAVQYPFAIAFPLSTEDVAELVRCARGLGLNVVARNGKHSFEGDSSSSDGLVIDVSRLVAFKPLEASKRDSKDLGLSAAGDSDKRAWVGAGHTLGQVFVNASKHGWFLPAGHCSSVGLTGLVLVGGQGVLSRKYGITADFVEAIEVVTAEGERVIARADQATHKELLWLARGGGAYPHFPGVITRLMLRFLPMDFQAKNCISFKIYYEATLEMAQKVFAWWQDYAPNAERGFLCELWIRRAWNAQQSTAVSRLYITGLFRGPMEKFEDVLARDVIPRIGSGIGAQIKAMTMPEFVQDLSGVKSLAELSSGKHGWNTKEYGSDFNRWKGASVVANGSLSDMEVVKALAKGIWNTELAGANERYARYIEFKPLRGAIDEVGRDSAGFWHRGAAWWALMSAFWSATSDEGRVGEYVADWMEAHKKLADGMKREGVYGGQYAGYVNHDGHSSVSEELKAYYGAHTARVEQIRKRWDPHGRFKHGRWCRAARTGACTIT